MTDLTKGRLDAVRRRQKLEVPLESSMLLGRPQVRKNPLSSRETTVPRKPKVWEAEWGTFPRREPIPLKRRGLRKNPRLKEPGKVGLFRLVYL